MGTIRCNCGEYVDENRTCCPECDAPLEPTLDEPTTPIDENKVKITHSQLSGLNTLSKLINLRNCNNGFWPELTVDKLFPEEISDDGIIRRLFLIGVEGAEAGEELRSGHAIHDIYYNQDSTHPDKPEGFPIEIADLLIRTLDLVGGLGIDIEKAMKIKMAYNSSRPVKHGRAF